MYSMHTCCFCAIVHSKQRQLDIALKKIEMFSLEVSVSSEVAINTLLYS